MGDAAEVDDSVCLSLEATLLCVGDAVEVDDLVCLSLETTVLSHCSTKSVISSVFSAPFTKKAAILLFAFPSILQRDSVTVAVSR